MRALKGLILAAGRGTRLAPLTDNLTKALVPLANRPLIEYSLDKLLDAGISEIGIVVGSNEGELRTALAGHRADLSYILQAEPKGLAHAVGCAKDFCASSDFVLLFCDNLFAAPLGPAVSEWDRLRSSTDADQAVTMIHTFAIADPRACGVALVEDGWVTELEEKPALPRSNLAIVGIDFFTPDIFDAISRIGPSKRGEYEITDAIAMQIVTGQRVRGRELEGFWFDTGTFKDLVAAHGPVLNALAEFTLQGTVRACSLHDSPSGAPARLGVGPGSQMHGCAITGSVLVGDNSHVTDCQLGPDVSIASGCTVSHCSLRNVQVHQGSVLAGLQDADCIYFEGQRFAA